MILVFIYTCVLISHYNFDESFTLQGTKTIALADSWQLASVDTQSLCVYFGMDLSIWISFKTVVVNITNTVTIHFITNARHRAIWLKVPEVKDWLHDSSDMCHVPRCQGKMRIQ